MVRQNLRRAPPQQSHLGTHARAAGRARQGRRCLRLERIPHPCRRPAHPDLDQWRPLHGLHRNRPQHRARWPHRPAGAQRRRLPRAGQRRYHRRTARHARCTHLEKHRRHRRHEGQTAAETAGQCRRTEARHQLQQHPGHRFDRAGAAQEVQTARRLRNRARRAGERRPRQIRQRVFRSTRPPVDADRARVSRRCE